MGRGPRGRASECRRGRCARDGLAGEREPLWTLQAHARRKGSSSGWVSSSCEERREGVEVSHSLGGASRLQEVERTSRSTAVQQPALETVKPRFVRDGRWSFRRGSAFLGHNAAILRLLQACQSSHSTRPAEQRKLNSAAKTPWKEGKTIRMRKLRTAKHARMYETAAGKGMRNANDKDVGQGAAKLNAKGAGARRMRKARQVKTKDAAEDRAKRKAMQGVRSCVWRRRRY